MLKLCFFVPKIALESVKTAVFEAGAGRYKHYDQCCWQTLGQGQFRALAGSKPFIGQHNALETVSEYRVEMICDEFVLGAVITALKNAHPYEEPAFDIVRLVEL